MKTRFLISMEEKEMDFYKSIAEKNNISFNKFFINAIRTCYNPDRALLIDAILLKDYLKELVMELIEDYPSKRK
jgi:hypothetical protein